MTIPSDPQRYLDLANVVYVASAFLTVIATFCIVVFGNRVANVKSAELKAYQREADARIAEANAKAAEAHSTIQIATQHAEEAKATAQQAHLDTAKIEHDNLVLRTQLEEERQGRLTIEKQLAPRRLSLEQRDKLTAALKPLGGQDVDVFIYPNDPEIQDFTNSIAAAFKTWNGWTVHGFESPVGLVRGVYIEYDPKDKAAEARASTIMYFFRDAGMYVSGPFPVLPISPDEMRKGISYESLPTSTLRLTIGHK